MKALLEKARALLSGRKTYLSMAAKAAIGVGLLALGGACTVHHLLALDSLGQVLEYLRGFKDHSCMHLFTVGVLLIVDGAGGASLRAAIAKAENAVQAAQERKTPAPEPEG